MNFGDHGIAVRSKAIGMLGVQQRDVDLRLSVGLSSIKRWWAASKRGQSLETKARSGRPKILNRVAKIVIAKTLEKRRHSARKIAKSLDEKGYSASSSTAYRHLTKNLGARAFNRPQIPRITEKIKGNLLLFAGNQKIGGRFFGQTNPLLNYFQHQTGRTIEYGAKMAKKSPQFSR